MADHICRSNVPVLRQGADSRLSGSSAKQNNKQTLSQTGLKGQDCVCCPVASPCAPLSVCTCTHTHRQSRRHTHTHTWSSFKFNYFESNFFRGEGVETRSHNVALAVLALCGPDWSQTQRYPHAFAS